MNSQNKREVKRTSQFKKDYKASKKQGRNIGLLMEVIEKLANDESLLEKHRDHALKGNWKGFRECHIAPDWLLVYRKYENPHPILNLVRLSSHSNLGF
jgi:mRNA interferase YafQ